MSYNQGAKKSNDKGFLYVKGKETSDGSRRLRINEENEIEIQEREEGVWNLSSLELSPETVKLGKGVSLSTIGSFVLKNDLALGTTSITSEMNIDDSGSETPKTSVWAPGILNLVAQPLDSLELTAKSFFVFGRNRLGAEVIASNLHLRTGSIGALADVNFEIRNALSGNLYFNKTYPASLFSPNTEVLLDLGSGVSLLQDQEFSMNWKSDEDFSLKGFRFFASNVFRPWLQWDLQFFNTEELISFNTGTDKIIADKNGDTVINSKGNIMSFEYIDDGITPLSLVFPSFTMEEEGGIIVT